MSFCFNKDFFCIVLRKQWPFHLSIQLPRYTKSYQKMVKTEIWIVIIIIFKRYSFNKCIWSHYFLTGRTILASSWRTTCCLSCLFSTWTHHKSQGNSGKESQRKEVERGGGVSLSSGCCETRRVGLLSTFWLGHRSLNTRSQQTHTKSVWRRHQ